MFHRIVEGSPLLVASTQLTYSATTNLSKLIAAQQFGHRRLSVAPLEYRSKALPASEFHYSEARIDDTLQMLERKDIIDPPSDGRRHGPDWVDLDAEGVSGLLTTGKHRWGYKSPLAGPGVLDHTSTREPPRFVPMHTSASLALIEAPQLWPNAESSDGRFLDLAGDGSIDLVEFEGAAPGFHERSRRGLWSSRRSFSAIPHIDWSSPKLFFADLTGDGLADLVVLSAEGSYWRKSLGEDGFSEPEAVTIGQLDQDATSGLEVRSPKAGVYFTDMTGDGLADLVKITSNSIIYWPNIGYGRFADPVNMPLAEPLATESEFDRERLRISDIDGTGTSDLIYIGTDGIRLFFNQSGNSFGSAVVLKGVPDD